jgi:hypothetical protein
MNERMVRLDDKLSRDEISVGQYDPEYFEQDGTLLVHWQKWFWENSVAEFSYLIPMETVEELSMNLWKYWDSFTEVAFR